MDNYLPDKIIVKLVEDEKLKAIITLKFNKMVIKGFRVLVSKYENNFWVVPPSYWNNKSRTYHPMFYIEDKEIWGKIQNMILERFDEVVANGKQINTDEEIPIEEIEEAFRNS